MDSLSTITNIYTGIYFGLNALLILIIALRVRSIILTTNSRVNILTLNRKWLVKALKVLLVIALCLISVDITVYSFTAIAYKSLIPPYLNISFVVLSICVAFLEFINLKSISLSLINGNYKKIALSVIVLLLSTLSVYLLIDIPKFFKYPTMEECVVLELPIKGTWLAGHAGGSAIVNYHCMYESQNYAIDIIKVNEKGRFYQGEGNEAKDFFTFDQNIYAPMSGVIQHLVDSLPTEPISMMPNNKQNPAGNHIVIKIAQDKYVFLAHLNKGSILVKKGDIVQSGQLLAKAGNSGNTSYPHLHMHIQNLPNLDFNNAKGIPFRFGNIEVKRWISWANVKNSFLIRNDLFRDLSVKTGDNK